MVGLVDEQRRIVAEKAVEVLKGKGYHQEVVLGRIVKGLDESLPWFIRQQGVSEREEGTPSARGKKLDAAIRSVYRGLQSAYEFADAQDQSEEEATLEKLLQYLFKEGIQDLVLANLQAQVGRAEVFLRRCKEPSSLQLLKTYALEGRLEVVEKNVQALEKALKQKDEPKAKPSGAEMQAARLKFEQAYMLLRRQLRDRFDESIPEEKSIRDQLAAIIKQAEEASKRSRRGEASNAVQTTTPATPAAPQPPAEPPKTSEG